MLKIHEFWTNLLPVFQDNVEFIYYYLDISTVLIFIKLFIAVPKMLLTEPRKAFKIK